MAISSDKIQLRYLMREGDELTYRTEVATAQILRQSEGEPQSSSNQSTIELIQLVTAVEASGVGHLEITFPNGELKPLRFSMEPSGELLASSMTLPFSVPAFPKKKLGLGDSWKSSQSMEIPKLLEDGTIQDTKQVTLIYHYTLKDLIEMEGRQIAKLHVEAPKTNFTISAGVTESIAVEGQNLFALDGYLLESTIVSDTVISVGPVTVETHVEIGVHLTQIKGGGPEAA